MSRSDYETAKPGLNLEEAIEATENTEATEWTRVLRKIVFLLMCESGKAANILEHKKKRVALYTSLGKHDQNLMWVWL